MKICLISSLYGLDGGGAGLAVQQLAEGLHARGWQVTVITLAASAFNLPVNQEGFTFHALPAYNLYPLLEKDVHPAWQKVIWQLFDTFNPFMMFALLRVLKHEKPDLVHIHKMRGFSAAVWLASDRVCPGRVVQTCHDYESISPLGTLTGRLGLMVQNGHWLLRPYQLLRAFLSRWIRVVVCPSQYTMNVIRTRGLFSESQPVHLPNTHGLSEEQLPVESELRTDSGLVHFLYLGRLEPEKGVIEACRAFVSLQHSYSDIEFSIAGWGTRESELKALYASHPRIHFHGMVTGKTKEDLLVRSHVLLVPSTYAEIAPLVILEAYAHGKPVIVSPSGGLPELVEHGKTGFIASSADANSLENAMEEFVLRKTSFSHACLQRARDHSLENYINSHVSIYERVMGFS